MMVYHLPDPAAARVRAHGFSEDCLDVRLVIRDAAHADSLHAVLEKAKSGGYAVEIRLLHYEGQPDMVEQARARKARKAQL